MNIKRFVYKGPIMVEDDCVNECWTAETNALDEKDAYNRFIMKCRHSAFDFLDMRIKITLPGKLMEVKV